MSQPDPMPAAARETVRKAGTLAVLTAAVIKLIIEMLREHQRREAAAAQAPQQLPQQTPQQAPRQVQQQVQPAQATQGQPAAADPLRSVHEQVFAGLPQEMARILTTSPQLPELAAALRQVEAEGANVPGFLAALGPTLDREQARITSAGAATAVQPPAPVAADRPGLRERIRDVLTRNRGPEAAAPPLASMSPDDQMWAVVATAHACGVEAAEQLVRSAHWPGAAQDIVILGYAHKYGLTNVHPAQVLENAWRAQPGSSVDWPTAATVSLSQARDQFRRGETAGGSDPAARPDPAHGQQAQTGQVQARPQDTQPVPVQAEQTPGQQPQDTPAQATSTRRSRTAAGEASEAAPAAATAKASSRRQGAATGRSSTVAADAQVAVGDHGAAATPGTPEGPSRSHGRTR